MKFMLMMHVPYGTGQFNIEGWSPENFQAHIAFMHSLNAELAATGELVDGQGLAAPGETRVIRAGKDQTPVVSDGPFAESKEFLAGFWIVEVDRPERAYEIAGRISAAPGPGGAPLNMAVEVRQVMSAPPTQE